MISVYTYVCNGGVDNVGMVFCVRNGTIKPMPNRWKGKSKKQVSAEMSRIRREGWAKKTGAEKTKNAQKLLTARWGKK